jgi:hypothetical protein
MWELPEQLMIVAPIILKQIKVVAPAWFLHLLSKGLKVIDPLEEGGGQMEGILRELEFRCHLCRHLHLVHSPCHQGKCNIWGQIFPILQVLLFYLVFSCRRFLDLWCGLEQEVLMSTCFLFHLTFTSLLQLLVSIGSLQVWELDLFIMFT